MKWYRNLYCSDNLEDEKKKIIKEIRHHKRQWNIYVITLARNNYDLFDIYHVNVLYQPYYRKREDEITVIGIAKGKEEAMKLVEKIVMDVYQKTGDCKVKEYVMLNY